VRQARIGRLGVAGVVMIDTNKPAAVLLVLSGLSDLGAVPLMVGGHDKPTAAVAVGAVVFAVVSLVAALGVRRGEPWARPLGIGSRALDLLAIIPAAFGTASAGLGAAAAVTAALSVAAIVVLARTSSNPALDHVHGG
jgi:hypothetical protein